MTKAQVIKNQKNCDALQSVCDSHKFNADYSQAIAAMRAQIESVKAMVPFILADDTLLDNTHESTFV